MKIRLLTLLIAFLSLPVQAQSSDRSAIIADREATSQRSMTLQALGQGATFTAAGQQYQVLPGARATQSIAQETQQQTITRAGGVKLLESKGNFVLFSAAQQSTASVSQVNGVTTYPTALNARTGGIGILPGTLKVTLKNMAEAAAVGNDLGLELVRQFDHLQTAFYRVKPGQDVVTAAMSLQRDARVASAEVEVLEHMNVPH